MLALPFALGLLCSFVACGDDGGDVGAPCNVDADCGSGLTCDVHDGQGSCQEPHGHDGDETDHHDSGSSGHHESETGHHDSETGHHDSGSSGHHDSGSSGHSHESGESGHDSGSGSGSSSGA